MGERKLTDDVQSIGLQIDEDEGCGWYPQVDTPLLAQAPQPI